MQKTDSYNFLDFYKLAIVVAVFNLLVIQAFAQLPYAESFKNYILENILDMETIDKIYEELASGLVDKLEAHRTFSRNFNYENFIYREIDNIYDYEILRRAVKKLNNNVKTRENAITAIRKVLLEYEREKGIIVMNTYEAILDIRETIENSFRD